MKRLTLLSLLLPLALFAAGCSGDESQATDDPHAGHGHGDGAHAEEAAMNTCPPCGMDVPADVELVELAGMKFAFCNDACRDKVADEPQKYAEFAVP